MTDFSSNMRITIGDMARTIRAQIEIEKAKRPDLHVQLMAIAATADEIETEAREAESLSAVQLISHLGTLRDLLQDLNLLIS